MLSVELNVRDIPSIYGRFAAEVGDRHWQKRVELLESEIRGNGFLDQLLRHENAIAFQLERLRQLYAADGPAPSRGYDDAGIFPAASFAAQVLSVIDASDAKTGERLKRRIHGALKNPSDMRGMRLELTAATHFLRAGRKVRWPEMVADSSKAGGAIYDLLVEDLGPEGLELECKSFSDQTGRCVRRRHALEFYGLVKRHHWNQLLQLRCGMLGVLTVLGDLPKDHSQKKALASALVRRMVHCAAGEYVDEGARIRVSEFDPRRLAEIAKGTTKRRARELMDEVSGTRNREVIVAGTPNGGAFMVVVQSEDDDEVLGSIFATLRDSASRQFSGKRAAMFVVGLDGLDPGQLLDVAQHDQDPRAVPTALRWHASEFLASPSRDHLVGVCFISAGSLRPASVPGVVDSGGSAYNFPKPDGKFWSEEFRGLYGTDPRQALVV